jgi:predicted membrane-bound spermidine synthase
MTALYLFKLKLNQPVSLKELQFVTVTVVLSILMAGIILNSTYLSNKPGTLLYETDGLYSNIQIREHQDRAANTIRTLYRETNSASSIMTGSTTFVYHYSEFARAHRYLQAETDSYLLIGGGAYAIPRTLLAEEPQLTMDVVELEPILYDLAVEYFELSESDRLTNYPMDARVFLNTTDKKYDVIFADAFQSGHFIPPHLITQEFFQSVADHLTANGVFVANVIGVIGQDQRSLTGSIIKTAQSVFPNIAIYSAQPHEDRLQNIILIAQADGAPVALPDDFVVDFKDGSFVPANTRRRPLDVLALEKQVIFTDNQAPIEPLLAKQLIEYY